MNNYEIENIKMSNRFTTNDKAKAFALKEALEKDGGTTKWRVGMCIFDRIIIDLDSHNEANMRTVVSYYSELFKIPFYVVRTMHGYHIIQKEKDPLRDLHACQVLMPGITNEGTKTYISHLEAFFENLKNERKNQEYTLGELQKFAKRIPEKAGNAGLYFSEGNIDVLFAMMGILRGKYTLRISKKNKNDKMEVMQ